MADRHKPDKGPTPYLGPMRPEAEWHEDMGDALFWHLPICEPPVVARGTDEDFDAEWHTHFQQIFVPTAHAGIDGVRDND